jgi:Carboxypeptidase regulatory-like domain
VITGRVLDEGGEPVRHANVALYYDDRSEDVDQIKQSRSSQTDDLGTYEFATLTPCTYFLSVTAKPWYAVHASSEDRGSRTESVSSLDVAYPITYYGDVGTSDSATPILIQGGERVEADIHLAAVPALHLFFHVPGDLQNGMGFPQLQQTAFDGSIPMQGTGGRIISPGIYEITGIPAGHYDVRMGGPGSGVQLTGIDINKDGEQLDTSHAEALSTVKVSLRLAGNSALPDKLIVTLRSGHREDGSQQVNSKGEAEFQQVPAGKYDIAVSGSKAYSISRITGSTGDISGHSLNVAPGTSPIVSVTLAGNSVDVQGRVKSAGKPCAGAMVVLVPKHPEFDRELFRRDQSDLDGGFILRGVVPGSYTLVAIQNGWDLDWSHPGVMAAYVKRGQPVEVGEAGYQLNRNNAIEAQSK